MNRILITVIVIGISSSCFSQHSAAGSRKQLDQLRVFAEGFKPVYVMGKDTMVVAGILMPPDSLNLFLHQCIAEKRIESYKYCFLIVMKLAEEFISVNKQDYDFCGYRSRHKIS